MSAGVGCCWSFLEGCGPIQPQAKQAGADQGLCGGLLPRPFPGYLEEEAQHEGQGPEAEAGAYLLGVHALVGKQAPCLFHLLQLWGRGPEGGSEALATARAPRAPSGEGGTGLGEGPRCIGLHGCRTRGRPPPGWADWGCPRPLDPTRTPCSVCLLEAETCPLQVSSQRGAPGDQSRGVPSQGVLVWDQPSSVTTGGRGMRVADPARPLATFRGDRLIVAFLRQTCLACERAEPQLGCLE